MRKNEIRVWETVNQTISPKILAIFRLLHIAHNSLSDPNDGPVLVVFEDNSYLFLDSDVDEETLTASTIPWDDPFTGNLDDENQQWINQFGKESYFEVSNIPPYSNLIGQNIQEVTPIFNPRDVLSGIQMKINNKYLNFYIWGGAYVVWGKTSDLLKEQGFKINRND